MWPPGSEAAGQGGRLAPGDAPGSGASSRLTTDWDWPYRFVYVLLASILLNPEDPAQWVVDLGLNEYQQKARDVWRNIAIVEQRHTVVAAGKQAPRLSGPVSAKKVVDSIECLFYHVAADLAQQSVSRGGKDQQLNSPNNPKEHNT